jgi:diguanylate cyclase (GGDEF)-like protein
MPEATLAAILDAADEGFIVFDAAHRCSFVGRRMAEIFGVERGVLVGAPEADVLALLASACEEPATFASHVAQARTREQSCELELQRPTLRIAHFRTYLHHDGQPGGGGGGWIGVVRDVTRERSAERRALQLLQRLEQITSTDALTQLPNRRRFGEELDREHGRASRAWDSYAVLRIDVDGFGALNAELGRARGDELLEKLAPRLREGLREYDLLARWTDDEFALLLPSADAHGTRVVAQRVAAAVARQPIDVGRLVGGLERAVTVTIGGAVWVPPSGESGADVMERAGAALATARARGHNELEIDTLQSEPSKPIPPTE